MNYQPELWICTLQCTTLTESKMRLFIGRQYKKLGDAMCKLVYSAIGKYIHLSQYRQIVETASASKLGLELIKKISVWTKNIVHK